MNLLRQVTSVRECHTDLHVCLSSYHILNTPSLFSSLANIPSLPLMCQCFCCLAIIACCFNISITAAYTCSLWGMFSRHSPTSVVTIFIGSDDHQDWMPGYVFQCWYEAITSRKSYQSNICSKFVPVILKPNEMSYVNSTTFFNTVNWNIFIHDIPKHSMNSNNITSCKPVHFGSLSKMQYSSLYITQGFNFFDLFQLQHKCVV